MLINIIKQISKKDIHWEYYCDCISFALRVGLVFPRQKSRDFPVYIFECVQQCRA